MNKHTRKILSIMMLSIFSCNTIITYKIHAMAGALPLIETAAEQVPRVLIATGACLAGLAMTLWNRHQDIQPAPVHTINPSIEKTHINTESIPATVSIVSDINPQLEDSLYTSSIKELTTAFPGNATPPAIPQPAAKPISVAQPISIAVDISTAKIGGDIARAEEQQLAASIPCNEVKAISFPVAPSYTIERIDLPAGVAYSVDNGLLTLTIDWSGQQAATNALRYANSIFLQDVAKLQSNMLRFPKFCELVTQQLKQISWCFTHIASTDLIERLYARLSLHKLGIVDPLQENLCRTINDLDYMFFHYDGTLCRAALNSLAYASDAMIGYIDWTDKQIGTIIPRDRYITKYDYERIKNRCTSNIFSYLYRQFTHSVGRCCRMTQARTGSANEYNKALELCLQYSAAFKFKLAEALRDKYNSPLFNDIIKYYKDIQIKAAAQQVAQLYDGHGIISIAQADPLYKQFAQVIQSATPTQKRAINDNFLVRHHLVSKMQHLWNIAASAPQYINDALYAILGTDCSSLSSLSNLQKSIQSIIAQAPAAQQQQLINTFYMANGILKEFAQHTINVQALEIPISILAPDSADLRNELNKLIASCIDTGQNIASIDKAVASICLQLNGNTPPTPVLPKGSKQPSRESPEPENNKNDNLKQAAGTAIGAAAEKVLEQNTEKFEAAVEDAAEFAETAVDKASKAVEQSTEIIESLESTAIKIEQTSEKIIQNLDTNKAGIIKQWNKLNPNELKTIGQKSIQDDIRAIKGCAKDAWNFFKAQITSFSEVKPGVYVGSDKNGIRFTYRAISKSGPPTIDINGIKGIRKIKFLY